MEKKDIALLQIDKIIVHDVPKHKRDDRSMTVDYSEKESKLTSELRTFFKDKIMETISKRGFEVFFDPDTTSPVPGLVTELMAKERRNIVPVSKEIAKHLLDIQTGNNPPGIVVLIEGKINKNNIIAILKLERDEGARLHKDESKHIIDIEAVKDLMLTKKTRLYKAGLFFERDNYNVGFDGYVSDNQIEIGSHSVIARFFLEKYLGCKLYGDTRTVTKEFFEVTIDFITKIEDPVKKAKYYEHLMSYTNKPDDMISPRDFCTSYLEKEDRQNYDDFLKQNHISTEPFIKNTELIESHLKKMMIDFENDVTLIARNGELGDKIKMTNTHDGEVLVEIKSKIRKVSS